MAAAVVEHPVVAGCAGDDQQQELAGAESMVVASSRMLRKARGRHQAC